jgi:hypothetical protein
MESVIYKNIPGFAGYRVGSDGTVWTRWKPKGGRNPDGSYGAGMVIGKTWRLLKPCKTGGNLALRVNLTSNGKSKGFFVHSLVLLVFVGPRPKGAVCRHGPKGLYDNSVENLKWGTQKENITDKERDGTKVQGVIHHNAKMTDDKVKEARRLYEVDGVTGLELAATMWAILNYKTWRHVK